MKIIYSWLVKFVGLEVNRQSKSSVHIYNLITDIVDFILADIAIELRDMSRNVLGTVYFSLSVSGFLDTS